MGLIQDYLGFLSNGGLIPYFAQGLSYLRDRLLPPAPATNSVSPPYTPPFLGGQCNAAYSVSFYQTMSDGGTVYYYVNAGFPNDSPPNDTEKKNAFVTDGAIQSITWSGVGLSGFGAINIVINGSGTYCINNRITTSPTGFGIHSIVRRDGLPDNCGNLPNPNLPPPISVDGLASSAAPDLLGGSSSIVSGSPLTPNGGDALANGANSDFSEAGALAPSDIAGALAKIAAGLAKVAQILSLFNEILELLRKLINKNNKSSFRYDFGSIQKDGFINMVPSNPANKIEWQFLDIQVTEVRVGIGKIFGNKSPNYYLYESIGRISFVSPTFGVLSTHPIQFIRTSIPIPPLAIGFFYHLGLDGTNKANVSGFYLKQE